MSSRHFITLDGLRGVAALSVMFMHVNLWFGEQPLLSGAYLAVDFFFCLSGFVVAHAYEKRLVDGMGLHQFIVVRLIRLYPLIFLGFLLGSFFIVSRLFDGQSSAADHYSVMDVARALGFSLLLIPSFTSKISGTLFPLDGAVWSLFFEIVANLLYAIILRLQRRYIVITVTLLFLGSLVWALTLPSLEVGFDPATFIEGFPRVGLSFFLGVLIFYIWQRYHTRLSSWHFGSPILLTPILLSAFLLPGWLGSHLIAQLPCILLLFPAIVLFGATHQDEGHAKELCIILGALSYPLYILHGPIITTAIGALKHIHFFTGSSDPRLFMISAILAMTLSWLALIRYDDPLRRWLAGQAKRLKLINRAPAVPLN